MPETDLDVVRRLFARQMVGLTGVAHERLEDAFANVPREQFLGSEPWQVRYDSAGFVSLPSNDPVYAYQDVLFVLDGKRGVNNGSPSLHAKMLHALNPQPGGVIAHIGAGTGYYSAILAELVGQMGHVIAVEYDEALASRARANLAHLSNVEVVHGDGSLWPQSEVDAVYVNFAVERPAAAWIDQLRPGGQLVFPLGVAGHPGSPRGPRHTRQGAVFSVVKAKDIHPARLVCPASFVCVEGELQVSGAERQKLAAAFTSGGAEFVQSLIWRRPIDPTRCWYATDDWALSYEASEKHPETVTDLQKVDRAETSPRPPPYLSCPDATARRRKKSHGGLPHAHFAARACACRHAWRFGFCRRFFRSGKPDGRWRCHVRR